MHPIEWLRAIARSEDVPHGELAAEAASALAALTDEPLGMVPACRRLLDRHPEVGPLWWACARMLSAADGHAEARAIQDDLAADQIGLSLALDLPDEIEVTMVGYSALAQELARRRPDVTIRLVDDDGSSFVGASRRRPEPSDSGVDERNADPRADVPQGSAGQAHLLLVEAWAAGDGGFLTPTGVKQATLAAREAGAEAWMLVGVGRRLPRPLFKALQRRVGASTDPWPTASGLLTPDDVSRVVEPLRIGCPCPPELL